MFAVSVVGLLVMWFGLASYNLDPLLIMTSPANEYITDLPNVVMLTFLAGIWFALFYVIYFKIEKTKLCGFLIDASKGILPFYIAQWIVIGWAEYLAEDLMDYEDYALMSYTGFWILVISTLIVSIITVFVCKRIAAGRSQRQLATD